MEFLSLIRGLFYIFLVIFTFIGIPLIIFKLYADLRSYRLSNLARKFGLDFVKKKPETVAGEKRLFGWLTFKSYSEEKNFIRGNIKNHFIEIYDRLAEGSAAPYFNYTKKVTIIRIDGVSRKVNSSASVGLLYNVLSDLRDKDLVFARKLWNKKIILYVLALLVAIFLFIITIY